MEQLKYQKHFKNKSWPIFGEVCSDGSSNASNVHEATLAVLQDIRGELMRIRAVSECHNLARVPRVLDQIAKNTKPKPRRRPVAKKSK